ncbi:hypothetical protein MMC10_008946 [Thelotrema lepadinum]|nr:hypothetical protein [Thelotrema lepadinum]
MATQSNVNFSFYRYAPSLAAAIAFIILFTLTFIAHFAQLFRNRTWYFIPFVIGAICNLCKSTSSIWSLINGEGEAIGYIGRAINASQTPNWANPPYILQSLLILIAPTFFSASVYMILGRLIRLVEGEHHSLIRPSWLTKLFVTSDVFSIFLQGAGGGVMASSKDLFGFQTGEHIIIGGLFIQIIGFGSFVAVTAIFHRRILRYPTNASRTVSQPWQTYLWVLYCVSALIFIRSIFRTIEYIQGYDGSLQSTETFLYVFDATFMFFALVIFNIYHPSRIILGRSKGTPPNTSSAEEYHLDARA